MSVGEKLKELRESKGYTIAEVSTHTKVQPWILKDIEADKAHESVSRVYLKGFIASYCRMLEVTPESLGAQEMSHGPVQTATVSTVAVEIEKNKKQEQEKKPISVSVPWDSLRNITMGLAVCGFLIAVVAINPLQYVSKITLPAIKRPTLASLAPITLQKKNVIGNVVSTDLAAVEKLELSVEAKKSVRVRLSADGRLLAHTRVSKGSTESWSAGEKFELVLSDPSNVELKLNGTSITAAVLSHQGRVRITREGVDLLSS